MWHSVSGHTGKFQCQLFPSVNIMACTYDWSRLRIRETFSSPWQSTQLSFSVLDSIESIESVEFVENYF